jgi:hypothetical protein
LDAMRKIISLIELKTKTMQHLNVSVQEAKRMDMINFLSQAGHRPQKINGQDY